MDIAKRAADLKDPETFLIALREALPSKREGMLREWWQAAFAAGKESK
jgi:hypothetical protein